MVPAITDDILIPHTANNPTIMGGYTAYAHDVTVDSVVTITIGDAGLFNVAGDIDNSGKIAGTGKVKMMGSATQYFSGLGAIRNLEIDNANGAVINAAARLIIDSVITLTAGNLTTNDSLVLNTDYTVDARVAPIASGSAINGKVLAKVSTLPGLRRYRFWSHPFSNKVPYSQLQIYIDITGTGGAANGFRNTGSNMPSVFRYTTLGGNSSLSYDPGWRPVTSALPTAADTNQILRHQGVRVFIRGRKGQGLGYESYYPLAAAIGQFGTLNQGHQAVVLRHGATSDQDYNLLGNPYASPVDLGTVLHRAKVSGNRAFLRFSISSSLTDAPS
ncbi:MAG: hypothetical protein EBZ77_13870 [Chitinophagia bacterium]|nr:hypothetical protein [Chitinophagia bacterium]